MRRRYKRSRGPMLGNRLFMASCFILAVWTFWMLALLWEGPH